MRGVWRNEIFNRMFVSLDKSSDTSNCVANGKNSRCRRCNKRPASRYSGGHVGAQSLTYSSVAFLRYRSNLDTAWVICHRKPCLKVRYGCATAPFSPMPAVYDDSGPRTLGDRLTITMGMVPSHSWRPTTPALPKQL